MHTQQQQLQELLKNLQIPLSKNLAEPTSSKVLEFAEHFFSFAALDELLNWPKESLYGATVATWSFIQTFDTSADPNTPAKIKIFNPSLDQDGWYSSHTVIQLLSQDMLLSIDSVTALLQDRNLSVHTLLNNVFNTQRQSNGQLESLSANQPQQTTGATVQSESLVVLEIDQLNSEEERQQLKEDLLALMAEIRLASSDFSAMRDLVLASSQALKEAASVNPSLDAPLVNCSEASKFLKLIADHHFLFLGYDEHRLSSNAQLHKVAGSELGLLKLGNSAQLTSLPEDLIAFTKAPASTNAMRTAYPDQILVKSFDNQGQVKGVQRFIGLYSPSFFNRIPRDLPILRRKVNQLLHNLGLESISHNGRQMLQVLDTYPQDDLLQSSLEDLTQTALSIFKLRDRRKTKVFVRQNQLSQLYSVLVYLPKRNFSAAVQNQVQNILTSSLNAKLVKTHVHFSTTTLCRMQFVLHFSQTPAPEVNLAAMEQQIIAATSSWEDLLHTAIKQEQGETAANRQVRLYHNSFPTAYQENLTPQQAATDIQYLQSLTAKQPLAVNLYQPLGATNCLGLKLFQHNAPVYLSAVVPALANLGLTTLSEDTYKIQPDSSSNSTTAWIQDYTLQLDLNLEQDLELAAIKQNFQAALTNILHGQAENDALNQLVIAANLSWRQIALLRGYAQYMQQIDAQITPAQLAASLVKNAGLTQQLIAIFELRFNPEQEYNSEQEQQLIASFKQALAGVTNLKDDQLLRRYLELIQATLRTNFYQQDAQGNYRQAISYKISPAQISNLPKPHPQFEIFVSSPRVEGVHLRFGPTARGGLRWSDRNSDYRTEVLGLVKAQQVKNAVIVPVGAKGGYVCKQMPANPDRDTFMAEGIASYEIFIRSLLDITDNLVNNKVVTPEGVVRHDAEDPYLVVAADKGTATFSDYANAIAEEYNFWLGDAFASGGSAGYDHKKMGITASGAWISVQRHFRELGLNTQTENFSVIGIGDMSGDVFGNGMLQSDQILLTAAFNHLHIFVDPNPADSVASFNERKRLFALPRSSWSDYKDSLISAGGGVFSRTAKSIAISPEMQQRFNISATELTPNELIAALMQAPVDLIWNGGIGTYVKGSQESHAQVGDQANDAVRINGNQLRCRVVGEGGNLGFTQAARIEAAQLGIKINADFIDNSGGVNCSDHEVNIKILLQDLINSGNLTLKQRNKLLVEMTDEVSRLVLRDNYTQSQALALAELDSHSNLTVYAQLINHLEATGSLDRELEFLPSSAELEERAQQQKGLTRPELAVLLAYVKAEVKGQILATDLPDDPWLATAIQLGFPQVLVDSFALNLNQHRLKRDLVATLITNQLVDRLGITYVYRMQTEQELKIQEIIRGYTAAKDILDFLPKWEAIEALDYQVPAQLQLELMQRLATMLESYICWLANNQFVGKNAEQTITNLKPDVLQLTNNLPAELNAAQLDPATTQAWQQAQEQLQLAGLEAEQAANLAATGFLDKLLIEN